MNIINETIQYVRIGETWGTDKGMLIPIILATIALIIAVYFGFQDLIRYYHHRRDTCSAGYGMLILTTAIALGVVLWHSKPIYKEVIEYTITIDDTVTAKEFFDKYELQSVDGNTYIVRDKGWENNE